MVLAKDLLVAECGTCAAIGCARRRSWWKSIPTNTVLDVLGATNLLDIGVTEAVPIVNKTLYHHFKPLHTLLTNPNWQGVDFFAGNYDPHKVYDDVSKIESYYLMNADSTLAVGWVHNLNAYYENSYYWKSADTLQNYLGCVAPSTQQISIPGFRSGLDYYISYFPTHIDTSVYPIGHLDSTRTGSILLDLITAPLGDTIRYALDTLHSDYAFIVALYPVPKSLDQFPMVDPSQREDNWEFSMYPNPTNQEVTLVLPDNEEGLD